MDLAVVHDGLVEEIQYGLLHVGTAPIDTLGDIFDGLAEQFEALALCHLLRFADQDQYRRNLMRSGHSRRYFLRRAMTEGKTGDRHLALGRTRSFLDVLAASQLALAREIADASTPSWNPDWEYEDDFCYSLLLHRFIQAYPSPPPDAPAILERFERSLEGNASARLEVCKALTTRDPSGFSDALSTLLSEERAFVKKERGSAKVQEGDLAYWPCSFVSIEGLALLSLAGLLGLRVDAEFDRCPQMARLPWAERVEIDLFEELERTP